MNGTGTGPAIGPPQHPLCSPAAREAGRGRIPGTRPQRPPPLSPAGRGAGGEGLSRSRGFTLIEILVALAVLALGLGALLGASASQSRNTGYLVERTLAQWVAANVVAGYRVESGWPDLGESRGKAEMGGSDWHWRAATSATDDPDLRRLEVAVRPREDDPAPVTTLVAYLGRPAETRP
ncbi:MAG TPA: type II secretion system minor pseudopilin GspI [Gammaproteobacteria bacterium]